jgi:hypothetical protein
MASGFVVPPAPAGSGPDRGSALDGFPASPHALRNSLFGISATLDALQAGYEGAAAIAPYLDTLRSALAHLQSLLRPLLEPEVERPRSQCRPGNSPSSE